jgi:hypothetical protein
MNQPINLVLPETLSIDWIAKHQQLLAQRDCPVQVRIRVYNWLRENAPPTAGEGHTLITSWPSGDYKRKAVGVAYYRTSSRYGMVLKVKGNCTLKRLAHMRFDLNPPILYRNANAITIRNEQIKLFRDGLATLLDVWEREAEIGVLDQALYTLPLGKSIDGYPTQKLVFWVREHAYSFQFRIQMLALEEVQKKYNPTMYIATIPASEAGRVLYKLICVCDELYKIVLERKYDELIVPGQDKGFDV